MDRMESEAATRAHKPRREQAMKSEKDRAKKEEYEKRAESVDDYGLSGRNADSKEPEDNVELLKKSRLPGIFLVWLAV